MDSITFPAKISVKQEGKTEEIIHDQHSLFYIRPCGSSEPPYFILKRP